MTACHASVCKHEGQPADEQALWSGATGIRGGLGRDLIAVDEMLKLHAERSLFECAVDTYCITFPTAGDGRWNESALRQQPPHTSPADPLHLSSTATQIRARRVRSIAPTAKDSPTRQGSPARLGQSDSNRSGNAFESYPPTLLPAAHVCAWRSDVPRHNTQCGKGLDGFSPLCELPL